MTPAVSVVVPAYNASGTIRRTLDSLTAQTFRDWEAIIVDDGSVDATVAIATEFSEQDPRISVLARPHCGLSQARNAGVARAQHPWLYFLDADDWIHPRALESMTTALAANSTLDAVHCGWALVAPDSTIIEESRCHLTGDLFPLLARRNAFAVHACVVSRDMVQRVAGFDPRNPILEDWVMWQRIARLGARFGTVPETLAFYVQNQGSLSSDPVRLFNAAMEIIALGHGPDPEVTAGPHVAGEPRAFITGAQLEYLAWVAGMMIARDSDPAPLLSRIEAGLPHLRPEDAAESIYRAVPAALAQSRTIWADCWTRLEPAISRFLAALEHRMAAPGHAAATTIAILRRILDLQVSTQRVTAPSVIEIDRFAGLSVDVTKPFDDIPIERERVRIQVDCEGQLLGNIELPVCSGVLRAVVLRDAIAHRFAWLLLQRFFENRVYSAYEFHDDGNTFSAWVNGTCIARDLPADPALRMCTLHDSTGWMLFLSQVWHPEVVPRAKQGFVERVVDKLRSLFPSRRSPDVVAIETSQPWPELTGHEPIDVLLTVGGCPLGAFRFAHASMPVSEFRTALTDNVGMELCRVAVREGLVGVSWADQSSLRERLAEQHARVTQLPLPTIGFGKTENADRLINGWHRVAAELLSGAPATLLGQRKGAIGGSASRVAELPSTVRTALLEVEQRQKTPVIVPNGAVVDPIVYAPMLVCRPEKSRAMPPAYTQASMLSTRHEFEAEFARAANPWRYDTPYEQRKYEQTLALIPEGKIGRALELACAEGHFTSRLANRVDRLLATDISEIALERASQRCRDFDNIEFRTLDLARDPLDGPYDLIVCSEVLYYVGDIHALRALAKRITKALVPGGIFLTAHARLVVDEPDHAGFNWDVPFGSATIMDVFSATAPLRIIRELRTPLYRIGAFQRVTDSQVVSATVENAECELPAAEIAANIVWPGSPAQKAVLRAASGSVRATSPTATARHMPILMYHRVAPEASSTRVRYCIKPDQLESQLHYLRECGFTSVSLDGWRDRVEQRTTQPSRPIVLTFDDGYTDFEEHAWPLIKHYGFSALLFVVTGRVGGINTWDDAATDEHLLDWAALRRLRDDGVVIGSHSVTHPRLTGVSADRIAAECVESRAVLQRELGVSVHSFAYPWGDEDEVVRHLAGASGYEYGLSCRPGLAARGDDWLSLPRVEMTGFDTLSTFIAKLAP